MKTRRFLSLLSAGLLWACGADPVLAESVLISEVVTDPQADHSENTGGNGVPYDLLPGDGTISSLDEFVEIFHTGSQPLDLTNYALVFDDTTPSAYEFGVSSGGMLLFSPGSSLDVFLPGGYALLGNPPGALNNRLDVLLRDAEGSLIDLLEIEDGNASSTLDEAVARIWTGTGYLAESTRSPITPLGPELPNQNPVPEPATILLFGVSAAVAARASARKARRERDRKRL
ncbi:MAG: lamin tail domain-containing protein [Planctomycetota bacterium]